MNRLIWLVLGFFLITPSYFAHAQSGGYYPKGGADLNVEDVSLIQLLANPQAYNNKRIRLVGFLHLEFEGNVLYFHSEDFQYALTKNGLWINVPKDMTQEQKKAVNDQYVICTAQFVASMHGHMGLNSGELADVTRLEVWSPHPRAIQK